MEHIKGKLYHYQPEDEAKFNGKWPTVTWSDDDQSWVLKAENDPRWIKIERNTPCIYIGRTNSVRMGAFLVGDTVVAILLAVVK
mgnify:CR=1 FL=1